MLALKKGMRRLARQADFFGQVRVAGEDIAGVAAAFLFEEVADAFIGLFELPISRPSAFRIRDSGSQCPVFGDAGFRQNRRRKFDQMVDAGGHGVFAGGLDRLRGDIGGDDAGGRKLRLAAFFVLLEGVGAKLLPGRLIVAVWCA